MRFFWIALLAGCATSHQPAPPESRPLGPPEGIEIRKDEHRLAELRQLTFGGENAEAYWSFGGKELVLQARLGDAQCDRIYRMDPFAPRPAHVPVSSGKGATTCSYFLPGDQEVVY